MAIATSERFRVLLIIMVILCLLPTAMMPPRPDALHNSGVNSNPDLFISAFSNGAASNLSIRMRSRLTNCLDDLLKSTLIPRPLILFVRKSLPSFFEDNDCVVRRIDSTVIPARAPPVAPCI